MSKRIITILPTKDRGFPIYKVQACPKKWSRIKLPIKCGKTTP